MYENAGILTQGFQAQAARAQPLTKVTTEGAPKQVLNEGSRLDLVLHVDRNGWHREVGVILLVLALPDELWIKAWIAGVAERGRRKLVLGDEVTKLGGRDVGSLVVMVRRFHLER
jgi:hypothetical protein